MLFDLCFRQFIPMPVLYGVFLYMGVSSLKGIQVSLSPAVFEDSAALLFRTEQESGAVSKDKFAPCCCKPLMVIQSPWELLLLNVFPPLNNLLSDTFMHLYFLTVSLTLFTLVL